MHIKQRWIYLQNLDKHFLGKNSLPHSRIRIIMSHNPQWVICYNRNCYNKEHSPKLFIIQIFHVLLRKISQNVSCLRTASISILYMWIKHPKNEYIDNSKIYASHIHFALQIHLCNIRHWNICLLKLAENRTWQNITNTL